MKPKYRELDDDWNPLGAGYVFTDASMKQLFDTIPISAAWDLQTALGDTLREKYESLIQKLIELAAVLHKIKIDGMQPVWAVFDTNWGMRLPRSLDIQLRKSSPAQFGTLFGWIQLFESIAAPPNKILMGVGEYINSDKYYRVIQIHNAKF